MSEKIPAKSTFPANPETDYGDMSNLFNNNHKKMERELNRLIREFKRVKSPKKKELYDQKIYDTVKLMGEYTSKSYSEYLKEKYSFIKDDIEEESFIINHEYAELSQDFVLYVRKNYKKEDFICVEKVKNGFFVDNQFISCENFKAICKKLNLDYNIERIDNRNSLKSLEQLCKDYIETEGKKKKMSDSTAKSYYVAVNHLEKFMNNNNVKIKDLDYSTCNRFLKQIAEETSEKNANNIIGKLSMFFNYLVALDLIPRNLFNKDLLTRYKINTVTIKRNFTIDELVDLFSGTHDIEKEILDVMRFTLLTGVRLEEFYNINENSFFVNKIGVKNITIHTAKNKNGAIKITRELALHRLIDDLSDYRWIKKVKSKYKTKDALNKKLNRSIDKVINHNSVSFHRLRGNFAQMLINHLGEDDIYTKNFYLVQDKMGHSRKKLDQTLSRDSFGKNNFLVMKLLGEETTIADQVYAKNPAVNSNLYIGAFDCLANVFKYLNKKDIKRLSFKKDSKYKKQKTK